MEKQIKDIDREINKRLYLAEESIKTLAELAYEVAAECKIYAEEISFLKDLKNKKICYNIRKGGTSSSLPH